MSSSPPVTVEDDLHRLVLGELSGFTSWLERHGERGFVGEVGWPNDGDARWQRLADAWYTHADRAGIGVTAWAAGPWWHDYDLLIYSDTHATVNAEVVERYPGELRGVNVSIGEFGTENGVFSSANPGEYGVDYRYATAEEYRFIRDRGVAAVRIPFRWERLQPDLSGPLDPKELERFRGSVDAARRAGLRVILDAHNQGGYFSDRGLLILGREIGAEHLARLWIALSSALGDAVLGLMNEPHLVRSGPQWEQLTADTVARIRAAGIDATIAVPGYHYSSVHRWVAMHPEPWIDDDNILYEAHHYWDPEHSGHYEVDYDAALAAASAVLQREPALRHPTETSTGPATDDGGAGAGLALVGSVLAAVTGSTGMLIIALLVVLIGLALWVRLRRPVR